MRSLILVTLLSLSLNTVAGELSPEARKQAISANIKAAAKTLNKHEHLFASLQVAPGSKLSATEFKDYVLIGEGWSAVTADGVWSLGKRSSLYLKLGDIQRKKLLVQGRYFNGKEATRLFINGQPVSEAPLNNLSVQLPPDLDTSKPIHIEFHHIDPKTPNSIKPDNPDTRLVKFKLQQLRIW